MKLASFHCLLQYCNHAKIPAPSQALGRGGWTHGQLIRAHLSASSPLFQSLPMITESGPSLTRLRSNQRSACKRLRRDAQEGLCRWPDGRPPFDAGAFKLHVRPMTVPMPRALNSTISRSSTPRARLVGETATDITARRPQTRISNGQQEPLTGFLFGGHPLEDNNLADRRQLASRSHVTS